ncbi:MAG: PQQ-binding-like beta-propeller repeat protein [Treponema sp.]
MRASTKKIVISISSFLFLQIAFAENFNKVSYDLSKISPDKVLVLGGNVLSEPVRTENGYVVIGEGRMISSFTQKGKVLWQRSFTTPLERYLTVGLSDLLYVVTESKKLKMLNPDGLELWSADLKFKPLYAPVAGRDGRVFVFGSNNVCCYGMSGILKWNLKIDSADKDIPAKELNDGSLLIFLNKKSQGKSVAIRISPFGKNLEQIIFAGDVKQTSSCNEGILLSFTDGSAGFCSVENGTAISKWVISASDNGLSSNTYISTEGFSNSNALILSGFPARAFIVSIKDGSVLYSINTELVNADKIIYANSTASGIVIADDKNAICINKEGNLVWNTRFTPLKKWNYMYATDNGYINFCGTNWVIESYRMSQSLTSEIKSTYKSKKTVAYNSFYDDIKTSSNNLTGRAISEKLYSEIYNSYFNGKVGEDESKYLQLITNEMNSFSSSLTTAASNYRIEKSFFALHVSYCEQILNLASSSGTSLFQTNIATDIQRTTDKSLLNVLIKSSEKISYDENGAMLESLHKALNQCSTSDVNTLISICDAVYEICRFMGRPAFFERGEEMLTTMLYPKYDSKIRGYARKTLLKISELKL